MNTCTFCPADMVDGSPDNLPLCWTCLEAYENGFEKGHTHAGTSILANAKNQHKRNAKIYMLETLVIFFFLFCLVGYTYAAGFEKGTHHSQPTGPGITTFPVFQADECAHFEDGSFICKNESVELSGCTAGWTCSQTLPDPATWND